MKIGYFTSAFPYKNPLTGEMTKSYVGGGVENVTYNLAVQMAKKGHNVFVFTSSMESNNSIEYYENIIIYRYKTNFKINRGPIPLNLIYKPLMTNIDLDIIHSQVGNLPAPLTAYFYAKKTKKPLVTTYHEDWMGGFGSPMRRFCVFLFDSFIADKLLLESNLVLTPSEYYITKSKHLRKVKNMVKAIPNGINLEEMTVEFSKEECREKLALPPDKKIILFVGSLTPRKAPDVLVKAMNLVLKRYSDSRLLFVGNGYYQNDLETLAKEYGILENITFMGFVDDDTKKLCYSASDIFVLPSRSEGFGIVLLEASAYGLPLIVSDLEVFHSVVQDGYNGFFTEKENERDLASKILCLLEDPRLSEKMGENAKREVQRFDWNSIADETLKFYVKVLGSRS